MNERISSNVRLDKNHQHLVIGRKAVLELMRHRAQLLTAVYLVMGGTHSADFLRELARVEQRGVTIRRVTREEFRELGVAGNHQGVAAMLAGGGKLSISEIIHRSLGPSGRKLLVVLDQLKDPQNLGAVLRVSEAVGADGVIITSDKSAPITPAVRKVSAGASELIATVFVTNLARALEELKQAGFWVVGTVADAEAPSLYQIELPNPLALVLGSEERGMRSLTKKYCDVLLTIPIPGKIDSLNVSQAAAVVLYEIFRRRFEGQ